jgi:hypothetical protein
MNKKKYIKETTFYKLFEADFDPLGHIEQPENQPAEEINIEEDCVLGFSKGNEKLEWPYFSLPSGYSCPHATICKNFPAKWEGPIKGGKFKKPASWEKNVKAGPKAQFMCYAARAQGQYPGANLQAFNNLNLLKRFKTVDDMASLIVRSMQYHRIDNTDILRVHEAGDFFSQTYFDAWMEVARRLPNTLFYAYTTSLPFWVARKGRIPANFKLIASMDEENEQYIYDNKLRYSKVVSSMEEASELGLRIDVDDSIAFGSDENFALLLHGPQPKGSEAAQALKRNKEQGAYDRIKQAKERNQGRKDTLRDTIKRQLRNESEDDDLGWMRGPVETSFGEFKWYLDHYFSVGDVIYLTGTLYLGENYDAAIDLNNEPVVVKRIIKDVEIPIMGVTFNENITDLDVWVFNMSTDYVDLGSFESDDDISISLTKKNGLNESEDDDWDWARGPVFNDNINKGDKVRVHNTGSEGSFLEWLGMNSTSYQRGHFGDYIEGVVFDVEEDGKYFSLDVELIGFDEHTFIYFPFQKHVDYLKSKYDSYKGLSISYEII